MDNQRPGAMKAIPNRISGMSDQQGHWAFMMAGYLLLILLLLMGGAIDLARVTTGRDRAYGALKVAVRSATRQLDWSSMTNSGQISINADAAASAFRTVLAENLRLDTNLNPTDGAPVDGPVTIAHFRVYNQTPVVESDTGYTFSRPGISASIIVTVRPNAVDFLVPEVRIPLTVQGLVAR